MKLTSVAFTWASCGLLLGGPNGENWAVSHLPADQYLKKVTAARDGIIVHTSRGKQFWCGDGAQWHERDVK